MARPVPLASAATAVLTGLAGLIGLAGCGGSGGAPATASYAGTTADCVVADPQGEMIVHPGSLTPAAPLRLDLVSLVGAVNLQVIESDVVPFTGNPTVHGVIWNYPPLKNAGLADGLADWDDRQPLAGRALSPRDGQQAVLVALRLTDPSRAGHLDGVRLEDSAGGTDFVQPVLVKPPGTRCTVTDYASTTAWAPAR
jgi:hypothetical protein